MLFFFLQTEADKCLVYIYIYSNSDDSEIQAKRQEKKMERRKKKTQNFNLKTKIYFGLLLQRSGFVLINFKRKLQQLMIAAISRRVLSALIL